MADFDRFFKISVVRSEFEAQQKKIYDEDTRIRTLKRIIDTHQLDQSRRFGKMRLVRRSSEWDLTLMEDAREHLFLPFMESILRELNERFNFYSYAVYDGACCFNPTHSYFLDATKTREFGRLYSCNLEELASEVVVASRAFERRQKELKDD
ncbi:hypothetical protein Pmar_PMAR027214, partial [Perkinsus marinus ATCC 50983]